MTMLGNILHRGALSLGYDAGESHNSRQDLKWDRRTARDEDSLTGMDGTRETIRLKAVNLRRNTMLAGVCDRIASFAMGTSGLQPQARTDSEDWNREAETFWAEWSKVCDIRQRISMWQLQCMATSLRPTHGGLYLELLDNGQVRPIECERIRQPSDKEKAKQFVDGVKIEKNTGIILGYQIHARDDNGGFTGKHSEAFVPRENIVPIVHNPWRPDQVREVPDLAPVNTLFQDVSEANQFALTGFKVQNTFAAFLKRVTGGAGPRIGSNTGSNTVGSRQITKVDGGTIFEGFPNEEMAMLTSPTPASNHIPYIQMQLGFASAGINFPYEFFTLDFSKCDFSRMKAVIILINKTCADWQKWISEPMQRVWNWRIAKAIEDGDLPAAPTYKRRGFDVSQWYRVDWQGPQEIQLDRQQDNQADMLEWQMGLGTMSKFAKRRGGDLEDFLREKARNMQLANEIEEEFSLPEGCLIKTQIPGQTEPAAKSQPEKEPAKDDEVSK